MGAGDERGADGVGVVGSGEHDEPRPAALTQVGDQVEAAAVGKSEVEHGQVHGSAAGAGPSLGDGSCLDDLRGAHGTKPGDHGFAHQRVIVDDHGAKAAALLCSTVLLGRQNPGIDATRGLRGHRSSRAVKVQASSGAAGLRNAGGPLWASRRNSLHLTFG